MSGFTGSLATVLISACQHFPPEWPKLGSFSRVRHTCCPQDTDGEVPAGVPECFGAGGYSLLSSSDAEMLFKYFC